MIGYRADIDGLRALAILPVVLFHAGIPGSSGGYVGVDVFFVISGFLITSIIRDEIDEGRFSVLRFYERRARRILPALFVVLLCCVPLAGWIFYPDQFLAFSRSLIAASLFVSSHFFRSETGYFDLDSEQKPLLHTWSLSVEEIFYIVFPLLLILIKGATRAGQAKILLAIALLSLIASSIALAQDPRSPSAFFLPYSRAWELLLGAILALGVLPVLTPRYREAASALGMGMILLAVFGYSEETRFPGVAALLPCVGAALILHAGASGDSVVGRVLSLPALVWIGTISYSLYLWHWPLLVFAHVELGGPVPLWLAVLLLGVAFVLAALSSAYIERPFRGRRALLTRAQVFICSGLGIAFLVAIGVAGVRSDGWAGRFPAAVANILFAEEDHDPRQRECLSTKAVGRLCQYGRADREPETALWGDSHAAMYAVMLGELAASHQGALAAYTMPACPPLSGWALRNQHWRETCLASQAKALQALQESSRIRTVILGAHWVAYPMAQTESGFASALTATIEALQSAGKQVVLIYPVPELGQEVPRTMADALRAGESLDALSKPMAEYRREFAATLTVLDRVAEQTAASVVRPSDLLCEGDDCFFYRDGIVYFYDDIHLSLMGAEQLRPLFEHVF